MKSTKVKKQYDFLSILNIVKEEEKLLALFKSKINIPLNFISYQHKNEMLKQEVYDIIDQIYNDNILGNAEYVKYFPEPKQELPKKPKRLTKKVVLDKIKTQKGVSTPGDEVLLSSYKLVNVFERAQKLIINHMYHEDKEVDDERCNRISETIEKFIKQIQKDV